MSLEGLRESVSKSLETLAHYTGSTFVLIEYPDPDVDKSKTSKSVRGKSSTMGTPGLVSVGEWERSRR